LLLPITVAVLLNFLFSPVVRRFEKWHIPNVVAAGIVVTGLIGVLFFGILQLQGPALKWLDEAPLMLPEVRRKMRSVEEPVMDIAAASDSVEKLAEGVKKKDVVKVDIQQPSIASVVISRTSSLVASMFLSATLLFFLLAAGDRFLTKCVELMPTFQEKRKVVETFRRVQGGIGYYLGTVTVINILLGVVIAIALWLLDVPNAALWGVMATFLNYVPFVGLWLGAAVVFLVSLLTFDTLGQAAVPTGAYLIINSIEANLVTPTILGRSMSMNPVAILLWMTFWGWMWGITGAILAVPLLAIVKITCEEIEPLNPLATFIAE
jgi:predicted PurR-regulated permease PerM